VGYWGPGAPLRAPAAAAAGPRPLTAEPPSAAEAPTAAEAETLLAGKARAGAQIVGWMHVSLHFQ